MKNWSHLVRFIAEEDHQIHLGQLVDTDEDVGLATFEGKPVKAKLINGTIFDGVVSEKVLTVKQLLSPITMEQANYIRCLGLNYKDHAAEGGFSLPNEPILFSKPRTALCGPYPETVNIPKCAQDGTSDYEAELCVVVGRTGRDIPEEEALDYVLGFTASNDISARSLQLKNAQWCHGKGLDSSCPIGPVLVSPQAIPDPQNLALKAIYDGQVVQDGNTRDMIFNIRQQIAYLSKGTTLEAGSIILTGTPAGIGYFRKPRVILEHQGDVRVYIDGIGTLINKIRYE